ncbi:hypothetical protein CCR75_008236 [Bremia lactucae]|uniref:Uncharacterized protein n=1 Tax=Bremia lactucae TaxID=4779 RepID=A0A976FIP6_BRELC|nr:hypothetical protein CCR75_008236 [Bremia lactucae]
MSSNDRFNDMQLHSHSQDVHQSAPHASQNEKSWQDGRYEMESLCNPDQESEQEKTNRTMNNGERRETSYEEQWRDASLAPTANGYVLEIACRVEWCYQVGKRFRLCWAHGGASAQRLQSIPASSASFTA